ncbi:N-acetylneuraminate synthase family protein, partial [Methylobacter sp.]|uniref:N-acetylneuraminate synthase family protein n=1 Tax=Methylobacter sp. TaxID=2051955 RepID=UPI00120EFD27
RKLGIEFLSTAFDFESLDFLVRELGVETLKIPSGEITNGPFLLAHAQTGKRIILSTGMATLGEVEAALGVLAFGYLGAQQPSSLTAFQQAYGSEQGQAVLRKNVTLLHCTSEYPTPMENINLKAMDVLQQAFGLSVGYSDHSIGSVVSVAAVARGATVIEKHFTLDRTQQGPDHKVSLEPDELKAMVRDIRDVGKALGQGVKCPQPLELENQKVVRKSLVARCSISLGERFTETNLTIKRPGTGRSPMDYWALLSESSSRNYDADELI